MQKVTSIKNHYLVNSGSTGKISLAEIKKYKFGFDLRNLRDRKIDTLLQINNLARRSATTMGNNCLLDSIFQQIQPLIPNVTLLEFTSLIRERIGKTKGEQLSINDDLEGTQIWTAVQAYLQQVTNDVICFEFSVLFADNEGEIAFIDMSGIENALGRNGRPIPLRIIFVGYNHYEPVFRVEEIPAIEDRLKDLSLESSRKTSPQQPLPAYVVNMPFKVDSDDEGEASSDEEVNDSFPAEAFQSPDKYFRLYPKEKEKVKRGTVINQIFVQEVPIQTQIEGGFSSLIPLFERELSTIASDPADTRFGICVGFNKMRSLSQRRNRSLLKSLNEKAETAIPIRKIGFLWDGIWQKSTDGGKAWSSTSYDTVRHFYKQLKKSDPLVAEAFRNATEKSRAHMVPYREIRDAIKNHQATKELTNYLRSINKTRDIYILFLDNDILSFRYRKDSPGALSIFDENYLSSAFEIASTGYTIREPDNLVLEVGILADLAVRNATAKHVKRGVYFPEPCTAVKIPKDSDTVPENFSDKQDRDYTSPQEMPRLIDKVLEMRKLDPQQSMIFDSRGAIVTALPNRMQRNFQSHSTQRNGIILWGLTDFQTMRGINQTHYSAYDWAHRMLEALSYHKQLTIGTFLLKDAKVIQDVLISLLSRLFNAFDPVELAQRAAKNEGLPFQICFIRILSNYKGSLNDAIPKTDAKRIEKKPRKNAKDKEKAVQKNNAVNSLWRWADLTETVQTLVQNLGSLLINDLSKNILAAAHESGAALAELFKNRLCLNYQELVVYALSVLIEKDVEEVNAQMPEIYLAMINDASMIQSGSIRQTKRSLSALDTDDFFGVTPIHMAAIAGNLKVALWLKENYTDIISKADLKGLLPLNYAFTHCKNNGINLDLLSALYDDETYDTIQESICEAFDDPSDQLYVLEDFRIKFGDKIITQGDETLFIKAILQGYNELADLLSSYEDYESALYEEILDLAPEIDDRLINWAEQIGIDLEEIRNELGESDRMIFEANLGWNEEDDWISENESSNEYDYSDE